LVAPHFFAYGSAMSFRLVALPAAAAVMVAACGPSSGQIRAAHEARYQGDQFAIFDASLEVAKASYGIADVDPMRADGHGAILTAGRWSGRTGEARPKHLASYARP